MRAILAAALLLVTTSAGPAQAQEASRAPIRAFDLRTLEALGTAIHRQDSAAWVASDTLLAKVRDPGGAGLVGWIVVDAGPNQKVRFLRGRDGRIEAGYDILVTPNLETTLSEPADRSLSADELAMFAARQTAAAAMSALPACRPGYNVAIAKDPERAGWLVWLLAPMTELGAIPIGGHYRFSVTPDGKTVTQRDALSASCMVMPKPDTSKGQPAAAFVTHLVSPTPVETHVFLQLQSRQGMFVAAGDHLWSIANGRVTDQGGLQSHAPKK